MAHKSAGRFRARRASSSAVRIRLARRQLARLMARIGTGVREWSADTWSQLARLASALAEASAASPLRRAAIEALEGRQLLSAVSFSAGTLTLTGDAGSANTASVDLFAGGWIGANVDGKRLAEPVSAVQQIRITGGSGRDVIYINPAIHAKATIATGAGDDTIKAGNTDATIDSGDGNDVIYGSGTITCGNGNDQVHLTPVSSRVTAGSGNDTIISGGGYDTIDGGGGNNVIWTGPHGVIVNGTTPAGGPTVATPATPSSPATPSGAVSPSGLANSAQIASVSFDQGTLTLTGNASQANSMSADLYGGFIVANSDGKRISQALTAVHRIRITGGSAGDTIYINPAIQLPAAIAEFGGNNTIKAGQTDASFTAGDGNNLVYASGTLVLGNGNNRVFVGNKASSVTAGNGNNQLVGGPGNDTLVAGSGHDTLIGGPGADVLRGGALTVYPDASPQDTIGSGSSQGSPTPTPPPTTPQANNPPPPLTGGAEDRTVRGTNGGNSRAPLPVINVRGAAGMAEQSVFVDALSSNLASGTPLTAQYTWNFGDPSGAHNVLPGFNAGHIYNNPGTYTITLTITNQSGYTRSLSTQVTVTASTRRTIYVDGAAGNDANSGLSPNQPVRTPARAEKLLDSNTTVLFHRGQTFNVDWTFNINYREVVVGAYGSGPAPVMKKVAAPASAGIGIFWTGPAADQVVIENLTMDSVFTPVGNIANHIPAVGVYAGGRNITVRNNTFLNIDDAVNSYSGPTGVLVENNSCPSPTGLRGYLDYVNGSETVILGNTVVNTTREHIVRSTDNTTQMLLIAGNNFDNSYSRQGVDPADFPKCTINIRAGHYVYIADNTLSDGMAGFGPGPWTPASDACEWVVLDGNTFHNAELYLAGNVHHLIARNNRFDLQDTAQIRIVPLDPDYASRVMSDITITNNTGVTNSQKGNFLELDGGSPRGIITVTNNLFAAPNFEPGMGFAAPIYVRAPDLSAFALFNNNVWTAPTTFNRYKANGVNYVSVGLSMLQYLTPQEWNNLPNVGTDQFLQTVLGGSNLQRTVGGIAVGAVLPPPLK